MLEGCVRRREARCSPDIVQQRHCRSGINTAMLGCKGSSSGRIQDSWACHTPRLAGRGARKGGASQSLVFKTKPIGRNIIWGKKAHWARGKIIINTLDMTLSLHSLAGQVSVARDRGCLGKTFKPGRAVPNGCRGRTAPKIFRGPALIGPLRRGEVPGKQSGETGHTHGRIHICPFAPKAFSF